MIYVYHKCDRCGKQTPHYNCPNEDEFEKRKELPTKWDYVRVGGVTHTVCDACGDAIRQVVEARPS